MNTSKEELMVTIRCLVFNHEPYIRQCLEGFVIQKTNFLFEAIIHDDASTDGTVNIIREYAEKYPHIIKPILETENQYSKHDGSINRIMNEHMHGKYIAICEGDDYWTDPYKLQKQVDFLEKHEDYVLSHTSFIYQIENENNKLIDSNDITNRNLEIIKNDSPNIKSYILNNNEYHIQTPTVLFRKNIYEQIQIDKIQEKEPVFLMGDTPLWIRLSQYGKIHFIKDVTTNYRVHYGSACRNSNMIKNLRFSLSCSEMRLYFANKYSIKDIHKKKIRRNYIKLLFLYKLFNNSYESTIHFEVNNFKDFIFFNICISKFFLNIFKPFYLIYRKFKLLVSVQK